jgi:uncharacterized repeat protein (TIGR01451 family)
VSYQNYFYRIIGSTPTDIFSLHPIVGSGGLLSVCPITPYTFKADTLNNTNCILDFGFICTSSVNFDLSVYANGLMRSANNSYLTLFPYNISCMPVNGIVTAQIDPQYNYSSANIPPTSINGQTLTWNLNNISFNNTTPNIYVTLIPATTLTPGDTACHLITITPTSGDVDPSNNTFNYCSIISASMDPNEKNVSPIGYIQSGDPLTYTINFENLGNDTAFNVHIIDTLSTNLVATSFELLASTHPVRVSRYDYNNTKIMRFDFQNINLGDKDHPESNKGSVIYRVNAKENLGYNTLIENTAHIYFDINPAVVTNTIKSSTPGPNDIKSIVTTSDLQIYPNPAQDKLHIINSNYNTYAIHIMNVVGQVVMTNTLPNPENTLDIKALTPGLYFINVINKNKTVDVIKFVKQ